MSSLIETTNNEDVPVSAVQPISGCNLPVNTLSRTRSYNAYNMADLNGVKTDTMSRRLQRTSDSSVLCSEETTATTTTEYIATATETSASSRTNDNETKSQEGLEEFITMLAGKDPNDTIHEATANIDHLLAIMKSRQMNRDTLHHIPTEEYHSSNNDTIFNFMFESSKSLPTNNNDNADSKPSTLPPSDFRFSFTSKESLMTTNPRNINIRRYRGGGGKIATPNVFYSTAYEDECDDDDDDDEQHEYESDDGEKGVQPSRHSGNIAPTSDISKLPQHLQHRKILPLPKPRWKRKGLQKSSSSTHDKEHEQQSANNNTTSSSSSPPLTPYIWQFSPPAREIQQRYSSSDHEDWGMSRLSLTDDPNYLFQEVFTSDDSSYRDNAKKMKRSTGSESAEYDERKSAFRRKDRKWRNNNSSGSGSNSNVAIDGLRAKSGIQLPESAFEFAMDKRTRDQLNGLPTLDDLPRPKSASLGLSNVLRQTMTPAAPYFSPPPPPPPPASSSTTRKSTLASPPPPPPPPSSFMQSLPTGTTRTKRNESNLSTKKKGKSSDQSNEPSKTMADKPVAVSSANTKRGKKGTRKKKTHDDDSHGKSNQSLVSDVALIRNPDPDEWICVFCQYEIFCHGLEMARRKGGYYRRRRERRRRLREVEARRAGECISGATSDFEDDPPVIDDLTHAPPPPPPPPLPPSMPPTSTDTISTMEHHQRKGKGNRVT